MKTSRSLVCGTCAALCSFALLTGSALAASPAVESALEKIGSKRGVICLAGVPGKNAVFVTDLAKASELVVFVQAPTLETANAVRRLAEKENLLGTRVFVATGMERIHLADNVADGVLVADGSKISEAEFLRVLRPRAAAFIGNQTIVKPVPEGFDDWSHPFHRADNNPQSKDQFVRGRFRTQFIATPKFSPMPEQTVIAGGRMYKAMGHISHKENQNMNLNTLLCINAYNGTILWKRPLPEGFMIHRNTMIATDDALYLGDHESCKVIDGKTGAVRHEITIPAKLTDGPAWKWMGIRDGILYALVGNSEVKVETQKSNRRGMGHWPWGMWKGHEYGDPETSFGYGRTLVAIDLKTNEMLWHFRQEEFFDARAVVMNSDKILFYVPEKFLAALNPKTGKLLWKNSSADLLAAIGPNGRAQHYITGYATTSYMKCTDDYVFFAGPQRKMMVVALAKNGDLAWTHPVGNLQLVLRDDAVYAAGQQGTRGVKLAYETGSVLAEFPARRACTRATGSIDSIFYRANGGTVRVMTETNTALHIAPMRPPCQDGVLISNGHLYWGPWMCGCQLSLYGNIGLAPQASGTEPSVTPAPEKFYKEALVKFGEDIETVKSLGADPKDWTRYRGDDARSDTTAVKLPGAVNTAWKSRITSGNLPTAPVTAGGMVFVADRAGVVHALNAASGKPVWKSYTAGPVYYPPAISHDRLFVGSADGKVYAFEAKTGRLLWTFRVGPRDQLIPVFGKLVSSWPVAGGIAIKGDTVFAAAGITHYDGTYVVALDVVSGKLKAHNTTSGVLAKEVDDGISLQGNLKIVGNELQFLGGGVYERARYNLETLACLNTAKNQVTSQFRTAFYPYYPEYNKYVSLEHTLDDGRVLSHDANYEGLYFMNLALRKPAAPGAKKIFKDAAGEFIRRENRKRGVGSKARDIWEDKANRRFNSFIVSGKGLIATGHPDQKPGESFLASINIEDGSDRWLKKLPAPAVKGGSAIDAAGRILVVLENGEMICFSP
jgi:outer membrane protein assembly factor BamB